MPGLIDADALRNALYDADAITMRGVAIINQFPTIDAVPVVRCKECRYLYDELNDYCCASHRGLARISENSFCSYGERRSE